MKKNFYSIRYLLLQSSILVGGQAVIEGVMMRVPGAYATAVRDNDGKIQLDRHNFQSKTEKSNFYKFPVIRGIVGLFESLKIGFSTLQWSADINMPENNLESKNKFIDFIMTSISILLALSLFFIAPIGLTDWLVEKNQDVFTFNLISGFFRIIFFLIYLFIISLMSDVKRLFQYHGAEHKTVYNFESGKELTINNAKLFPTQHPRCGTSFMFIIMLVAIICFASLDSIVELYVGKLTVWMRLVLHIPFIPVVAGIGYEVLKLTAKKRGNLFFKMLSQPGIWLQYITTKEPDNEQVEVALIALKQAFGNNLEKYSGKQYKADAIA